MRSHHIFYLLIGLGLFATGGQAQDVGGPPDPEVLIDDDFSGIYLNMTLWQPPSMTGFPHPVLDGEGSVGFITNLVDSVRAVGISSNEAFRLPSGQLELRIKGMSTLRGTFGVYLQPASDQNTGNQITLMEFSPDSAGAMGTDPEANGTLPLSDTETSLSQDDFRFVTLEWGEGILVTSGVAHSATVEALNTGDLLWHLVLRATHHGGISNETASIQVDFLRLLRAP